MEETQLNQTSRQRRRLGLTITFMVICTSLLLVIKQNLSEPAKAAESNQLEHRKLLSAGNGSKSRPKQFKSKDDADEAIAHQIAEFKNSKISERCGILH